MRRTAIVFVLLSLCSLTTVWAQVAKIVDVQGEVTVKSDAQAAWEQAVPRMLLSKEAEIKTSAQGSCTIAFDEELANVLTVKENSELRINDLKPAGFFLPKGKVFALIDDVAKVEAFVVRTPVAVAGVRGTGESVEHNDDQTTVNCFENTVYVEGSGGSGDVEEGNGLSVDNNGNLGDPFELSDEDYQEWNQFRDNVNDLRGDGDDQNGLNDLLDDRSNDIQDDSFLDERRDEEDLGEDTEEEEEEEEYQGPGGITPGPTDAPQDQYPNDGLQY